MKKAVATAKETVSKNPITTLYIVGGAVALYFGWRLYRNISNRFNPDIDDSVNNGNVPISNTGDFSISNQQAVNFAQQLLDAMNKNRNSFFLGGTDEDAIENVFNQLQTGDDFLLVYNAFGLKEYNGFNSPVEGWEWFDTYVKRDLIYWLKSELSSSSSTYKAIKPIIIDAGFAF
jgi:hypothetical protein